MCDGEELTHMVVMVVVLVVVCVVVFAVVLVWLASVVLGYGLSFSGGRWEWAVNCCSVLPACACQWDFVCLPC